MRNSLKLYNLLLDLKLKEVEIKSLNQYFTPVYLANQIHLLEESGIIKVNWQTKKINVLVLNYESLYVERINISTTKKRDKPKFMETDKTEINKPFLNINEGED